MKVVICFKTNEPDMAICSLLRAYEGFRSVVIANRDTGEDELHVVQFGVALPEDLYDDVYSVTGAALSDFFVDYTILTENSITWPEEWSVRI